MLSNLIIELYRAAQEMAVNEFQEFSIGLLKSLVPFDSARYVGGVLTRQGLQVHDFFLHNKPVEAISDYSEIAHADPVLKSLNAKPNKMIRFHPPTLFAGKENRQLFDYAQRFEHANGMSVLNIDQVSPRAQSMSIFRADKDNHFLVNEVWLVEQAMPHFLEAIKINKSLAVYRIVKDTDCSTVAISLQSGGLHFCSSGFRKLLNIEWPDWNSAILPNPLMDELNRVGSTGYCSANIRVSIKVVGNLLFLKASKASAAFVPCPAIQPEILQRAYGLTFAEARVAIAMLNGGSAKEVAIYLKVSPHTVRTQVRNIYAKFGVNTRVRFVNLMHELAR